MRSTASAAATVAAPFILGALTSSVRISTILAPYRRLTLSPDIAPQMVQAARMAVTAAVAFALVSQANDAGEPSQAEVAASVEKKSRRRNRQKALRA